MLVHTDRLIGLFPGVSRVLSLAIPDSQIAECTTRHQRKSWSALTTAEKSEYIQGELCLMSEPAKAGIPGAVTRWDELQYAHIAQASYVHGVGAFLPFHRYFMTVHEHLLRAECDYVGPIPYWDEVSDVGQLTSSDVFDTELGFGGNGKGVDRCITDGPFVNLTLRYNEDLSLEEYCISRNLNERAFSAAAQEYIDACMVEKEFTAAWNCLEGRPHGAGHGGVSGTMINPLLSPGDPIFFLHHTYLDKLWWDWQSKDLPHRLTEIGGNNTRQPFGGFPPGFNFTLPPGFNFTFPPGDNPFFPPGNGSGPGGPGGGFDITPNPAFTDYFNDGGNATTLNHTLWSANIMPNVTIADVMDIGGSFVCAEYI